MHIAMALLALIVIQYMLAVLLLTSVSLVVNIKPMFSEHLLVAEKHAHLCGLLVVVVLIVVDTWYQHDGFGEVAVVQTLVTG